MRLVVVRLGFQVYEKKGTMIMGLLVASLILGCEGLACSALRYVDAALFI